MKNADTPEVLVRESLNEGETVLWTGKPTGIKLLELPYGSPIIVRWVICLAIAAIALWYGLIYVPGNDSINTNGNVIMLVVLAIAIFIAVRPLMDIFKLQKKCFYYITNQRALILIKGTSNTVKGKTLAEASEITMDTIPEGRGNIYIGKKLENSFKKARISVLTPQQGDDDKTKPIVFYSVTSPDEVMKLLPAAGSRN